MMPPPPLPPKDPYQLGPRVRAVLDQVQHGDQIGPYRFGDNKGQFVNQRRRWQTDNRILAVVSGIGGDVSW